MRGRSTAMKAGLVLLGVVLVVGFYEILEKRFAEGGIYPHYASFRSDPLGTSVFYESLERLGTHRVSRNVTDLMAIQGLDPDSVLLLLGYPRDGIDELRAPADSPVMKAVEEGARLVLTLNPELVPEVFRPDDLEEDWLDRRRRIREGRDKGEAKEEEGKGTEKGDPAKRDAEKEKSKTGEKAKSPKTEKKAVKEGEAKSSADESSAEEKGGENEGKDNEDEDEREKEEKRLNEEMEAIIGPRLTKKLGFDVTDPDEFERPEEGWETEAGESYGKGELPAELPSWRSQFRFQTKEPDWRTAVTVEGKPVVIERSFGKGSIVLATDTYFVSNENLHLGAEPGFLLWLLGGKTKVVFDETIHGTVETGGAMKLIRRYRAHGIFFGLIVFLGLWAWRSASPLIPGSDDVDRGLVGGQGTVVGEETGSGLIRLLRRSVSTSDLLARCVEIWGGSAVSDVPKTTRAAVDSVLERQRADSKRVGVAEAYRSIVDLLRKR